MVVRAVLILVLILVLWQFGGERGLPWWLRREIERCTVVAAAGAADHRRSDSVRVADQVRAGVVDRFMCVAAGWVCVWVSVL